MAAMNDPDIIASIREWIRHNRPVFSADFERVVELYRAGDHISTGALALAAVSWAAGREYERKQARPDEVEDAKYEVTEVRADENGRALVYVTQLGGQEPIAFLVSVAQDGVECLVSLASATSTGDAIFDRGLMEAAISAAREAGLVRRAN